MLGQLYLEKRRGEQGGDSKDLISSSIDCIASLFSSLSLSTHTHTSTPSFSLSLFLTGAELNFSFGDWHFMIRFSFYVDF